jgi:hypothetical protein
MHLGARNNHLAATDLVSTAETWRSEEATRFAQSEVGRGLAVDDGRLAGLLSITDLAHAAQLGPARRR